MGDIADDCTEAGEDALTAHRSGECDMWCRYCDEETKRLRRKANRTKPRRASITEDGNE